MTKDGLVVSRDAAGQPLVVPERQAGGCLTAEDIFEGAEDGDYHANMTAESFNAWLKNRFFPTMLHLYPGKRIFLVLDNAAYHRARGEDFVQVVLSARLRVHLADTLSAAGL